MAFMSQLVKALGFISTYGYTKSINQVTFGALGFRNSFKI